MATTSTTDQSLFRQAAALLRTMRRAPSTTILGLGLVAFPVVLYVSWPTPIYDQHRIVQVFALLLVGLLALARGWLARVPLPCRRTTQLGLLALLTTGVLSVALAPAAAVAVRHASLTALLILGTCLVAAETSDHGAAPLQSGLVAFAALAGVTTVALALMVPPDLGHPAIHLWTNPRYLGQAASWTLPVLLGLTVARRGPARYALLALATGWVALAVFSGSRGAWVALPIGLGLGTALIRVHRRDWLRLSSVAIVLGIPLGLALNLPSGTGRPLERLVQDSGRLDLLARTFGLWTERPWFGVGPGGLSVFGEPPAHPHNAPLQVLAEWGLLAFAAVLLLLGIGAWNTWKRRSRWRARLADPFRVGLVASVTAGAAHSLVSGILVTPASQLLLVLVVGGLAASVWPDRPHSHRTPWAVVAVVAVLGLGIGTTMTLPTEPFRTVPRFWLVTPEGFQDLP